MPLTRSQAKQKVKGSQGTLKISSSISSQKSTVKRQSKKNAVKSKPIKTNKQTKGDAPKDFIFNREYDIETIMNVVKSLKTKTVTISIVLVVSLNISWRFTTFNIETIGHSKALRELNIKFLHKPYERTPEVMSIVQELDRLRLDNPGTEVHAIISGGPGSGKSELARQVGESIYQRDNCYHVFGSSFDVSFAFRPADIITLDSSSVVGLQCSLEEVISKLKREDFDKIKCVQSEIQKDDVFWKFRQLKQFLRNRSSRAVIIFDNIKKEMFSFLYKKHEYGKFLLHPGNDKYGEIRIVVTTQNRPSAKFQYVGYFNLFDGMNTDDGVELLNSITNINNDNKNARSLVKTLGGLPLSLVQAAFYIQLEVSSSGEYSYRSYLEEFELDLQKYRRNVNTMWKDCVDEGVPYNMTAIAASIKAIEQLIKTKDKYFFTDVACFVGYCDSQTISTQLLWHYIEINPKLQDYTQFLVNNLVRKSSIYELRLWNANSRSPRNHSLILTHQVTREASRAACNINSNKSEHFALEDYFARIVKVLFTGLEAKHEPIINQMVEYTTLNFKIVDVLMSLAKSSYYQNMNFSKVVTTNFCWMFLSSMADAYLYWPNKHKSTVIMPEVKFLVNMTEESFSNQRPELGALLSVLYLHNTGNQNPEDLERIATLVEKFGRSSFKNTDKTSIGKTVLLLNMIGTVYRGVGQNMSKAQELHELALNIAKQFGFAEEIAVSLHLLGVINRYRKNLNIAAKYHKEAVEIAQSTYSNKNPRLGAFLLNFAVVLNRLGKLKKAYEMYHEALRIVKSVYGPEDQRVARVLNTLATNCNSLGKYNESVEVLTEALRIHETIHGDIHPNVAETLYFLGFTYRSTRDLQNSLKMLQRSLEIREQYYGPFHFQVAEVLHDLSNTQRELHDFNSALSNAKRCHKIIRNTLGEKSSEAAVSLNGIGLIYLELGDTNAAKTSHEKALKIFKELTKKGSQTVSISETLRNLGMVYGKLGQPQKAKEYFHRSLEMIRTVYEEDHPRVVETLKLLHELDY